MFAFTLNTMDSSVPLEEILQKLADKRMWYSACVEKLKTLPRAEKPMMRNHCSNLRDHIDVLTKMEDLSTRGVRVHRSRIYWEWDPEIDVECD